jgi:hypothetical protein
MQKKKNVLMSLMKEGNRANNAWNTNVFTTKMLQPKIIYIVWFATREETQHSGMIILKNKNTKKGPLNN